MRNRRANRGVVPRPFLKWAGGKTHLLPALLAARPVTFGVYHEPFLGGGALFFALYRLRLLRTEFPAAMLSDLNSELMDTYRAIRDRLEEVLRLLSSYPYERSFYYQLRAQSPSLLPLAERAARMIYLNKTGYNGLYRVNRRGQFNVPFGRYKHPSYYDPENLRSVALALEQAELLCASFETVLERAQPGDWVYFDPPYAPQSGTADFTEYLPTGFGEAQQRRLHQVCLELDRRGVYVTVSNSDTPLVRELYGVGRKSKEGDFHVFVVQAPRAINCRAERRGPVNEFVITNYPPAQSCGNPV